MWTGRLRYFGFGFLLLGLVGALLLTWLLFNIIVFGIVGSTSPSFWCWPGSSGTGCGRPLRRAWARGVSPDDATLRIMDPGLRREFSAFLLSTVAGCRPPAGAGCGQ